MNWQEVCEHPSLQDLPFKIELNERGEVVMAPVKVVHSAYQGELSFLLRSQRQGGNVLVECAIHTVKGTKVADVAWASDARFATIRNETECSIAPEVCIEVLSLSNTDDEIAEKRQLYFAQGAREVWICQGDGDIHFYDAEGRREQSALFPHFSQHVDV
jgi:Uma2 family endonuclease